MKFPRVSIIIPVYNAEKEIEELINLLQKQNYPNELEILIIDNNSNDKTYKISKLLAKNSHRVKVFKEKKQGSYVTRNKGIKKSKHNILAFIDSDCKPIENWLNEGIKKMLTSNADLVGGNVKFVFKNKNNPAEIYDSISNAQFESDIKNRNLTKTGNLFIRKEVFEKIGLFPKNFISGGDVYFTKKATDYGFKLVYAPKAIVSHPTRSLKPLIKKQIRVGKGKAQIWQLKKFNSSKILIFIFKYLIPPMPFSLVRKLNKSRNCNIFLYPLVYFTAYLCKLSTLIGVLQQLLFHKNNND